MNITTFTGNLGRDFEVIQTGSGMTVAKNSLAVRRSFPNKQTGEHETDWIPITAFGKRAETMNQYLGKGSKVLVRGSLQTSEYTDKEGNKRTGYDVIVDEFEFLDSRGDKQKQTNPFSNETAESNPFADNNATDIDEDSLPF